MSDTEPQSIDHEAQKEQGLFRLDVVLTTLSGITAIDWDDDFWKSHHSQQPFHHEVGDCFLILLMTAISRYSNSEERQTMSEQA